MAQKLEKKKQRQKRNKQARWIAKTLMKSSKLGPSGPARQVKIFMRRKNYMKGVFGLAANRLPGIGKAESEQRQIAIANMAKFIDMQYTKTDKRYSSHTQ